ncbi:sulfatase-like hydrolase/transferase, partial [bacterium]|nr:sulfatase-like hydrolase/transferase [bacterium]
MSFHKNHYSRRSFLKQSTALAAAGMAAPPSLLAQNKQPNIIYIIVDDMGWADLSCYGQDAYKTPNLDQMAKDGIQFTNAYSGCTVCAPARSTLMTGHHMGHTSVRGNTGGIPLRKSDVTLAQVLKKAGYACGGFGKWGLGDLNTDGVPEKHGFDEFFGYYHQIHAHYY